MLVLEESRAASRSRCGAGISIRLIAHGRPHHCRSGRRRRDRGALQHGP